MKRNNSPVMPTMHPTKTVANRKFRLRTTLVLPFVLQIVAAVGLVGYLSFRNGQKAVEDLANQLMTEVGTRVSQHLDSYLSVPSQINQINLRAYKMGLLDLENFEQTGAYFWQQMQVFDVGYINYANQQAEFIGVERLDNGEFAINETLQDDLNTIRIFATDDEGNRTTLEEKFDDADVREEGWYAVAAEAGQPTWSEIYQWHDKPEVLSISSSYPVFDDNNRLQGVIGVDLILSQIGDFLNQIEASPSAEVFILERDGLLVAQSSESLPYKVVDGEPQRLQATESQDALMQNAAQSLLAEFASLNQIQDSQLLDFRWEGDRHFIKITPWQDKLGLNWLIVTVVPESDFMGQIYANTRNTIVLASGALVVAIIIGILTARWITRPILRVSQASDEIAKGNLDQHVKPSHIVEIERLADSFNSMSGQLKASFAALGIKNQALQEALATNTALISAIPDLLIRVTGEGQYLNIAGVNRAFVRDEAHFLPGSTVEESLPPDLAEKRMTAIRQALATNELQVYEQQLEFEGERRDEEVRAIKIDNNEVLIMVRDITSRKRAEEALRIAEENYRGIYENALEGIFQSSPDGQFISVNPAMAGIYGYDSPQDLLESITDIATQVYVDPEDRAAFKQCLDKDDRIEGFEYRIYQKDDNIIWIQEDTRAVRDNNGKLLYYEGIVQDITDRKRREKELQRQLKELKIEIDHKKRAQEVAKITQSDYFQELQYEVSEVNLDEFWS